MAKKRGRKVRVHFRQNREQPRRSGDWTRRYLEDEDETTDTRLRESVRAKGGLSRKRTIIVGDEDALSADACGQRAGTVTAVHGLVARVDDDSGGSWDCTVRRILRTLLIEQRSPVSVGDRVWFSTVSAGGGEEKCIGVIERVEERKTRLSRRERRGREHTIVANADQLLIVASVAQPNLKPHLIDRYLVAAMKGGLSPIICFNKIDLLDGEDDADEALEQDGVDEPPEDEDKASIVTVGDIMADFRELGYRCILTSVPDHSGFDELRDALKEHITVLSGQSGVGKSSLLNAIQPGLNLAVAAVSEENEKGRHTTSYVQLLRLDAGGYVVDTPGIRQFDLWAVDPGELEASFVEFLPYIEHCRFGDCSHRHEEGCAVMAAVESGKIGVRRYQSYLKLFADA